jgi:hypothetical protein
VNIRHLGDALDHWKGSVIGDLEGALHRLHVVPMFTDIDVAQWTEPRLRLYADLLRIDSERILCAGQQFTNGGRTAYIAEANRTDAEHDLFIDPDTGIEPPGDSDHRHLRRNDLATFLLNRSDRLALVYQHSRREDNWTAATLRWVLAHPPLTGCHATAYWAGAVSMIFISRSQARLSRVNERLQEKYRTLDPDHIRIVTI